MKIGFLINYFYPYKGGAEDNCFYLARELAKNNEVHVFTSQINNTKDYEIIDKIKVHRYKNLFRYKYYLSLTPKLLRIILKENLDILHVHSFGFIYHDLIVLLKKLTSKTKIVNTPHGPFMALKNYNLSAKIFKFFIEIFEKNFVNKNYDAVIQVNPYQYKWLKNDGIKKNRIYFIPNGISENAFKKIDKINFIKKYNLKNKFIISYLGRVQKYKGLEQVIKILPELNKTTFLIMGKDAGDLLRLKILAKELNVENKIIFTGEISEEEKITALNLSRIFIMPSEWEAFGITILEAMAQGNSIISTKTEGGKFLIKEKENGFLYNYDDLKDLENKIKILINNKKLLNKISKNNIKKAKQFLWKDIAKNLENLYKLLLQNH